MLGLVRINQGRKLFLVHFKIVPFNAFWKASPLIVLVLIMFGLLIPMGWGAPRAMLWSYATLFDVEQRQAEVDELSGRFEAAQWNLDRTVVRAPADGYVINLALRKGARVRNPGILAGDGLHRDVQHHRRCEINRIDARYIEPGQDVEAAFKFAPGQIYTGKVESVLQASPAGQVQTSGCRRQRRDRDDLHRPREADACRAACHLAPACHYVNPFQECATPAPFSLEQAPGRTTSARFLNEL